MAAEMDEKKILVTGSPEKKVKFDEILSDLGDFGRYQKATYFLLFLPTIFSAMQKQSWVFLGAKAPHRCRLPLDHLNSTYWPDPPTNLSLLIPWDRLEDRLDSCSMFQVDGEGEVNTSAIIKCQDGWVFDKTTFGSSAVMDWNLVCGDKGMRATAQALFMIGVLLGSYGFGWMSDKFGRKPSFFISVVVQALFGILSGIVPSYWAFVLLRMVVGATTSGVFLVAYVLAMEMVGPRYRVVAGTLCQYYYTFGYIVMAGLAYLLNDDWQLLQIILTLPSILFVSYWWIVPESVRWQISNGRYQEAKDQIGHVAARNRVTVDQEKLDLMVATSVREREEQQEREGNVEFWDLFRHKRLALRTLNLCFNWMVNSGSYYGLALSASNLGGNPYYNYLISAAVEIPAYAFNLLVLNNPRIGRRLALSGCMIFAGLVLTVTIFIPKDRTGWLVALSMLGKLAITSSYGTIYIFSAELYPTRIRNVGMGTSSMCARIGSILCPYINMLSDFWTPFPLVVYGGLALTGGVLALFLPETLGRRLPETIEDGEKFGTKEYSEDDTDEKNEKDGHYNGDKGVANSELGSATGEKDSDIGQKKGDSDEKEGQDEKKGQEEANGGR